MTLDDFLRIFKHDATSEKLMKLISKYSSNKGIIGEAPPMTMAQADDEVLVVDDASTVNGFPNNEGDSLVDQTNRIKQIWRKICLQSCRNIRA